ncbi:MAG: hypothetical protein Q8K86_03730 [Candidatus Nanopelagicaceae bacterium]|nr:hypothetical protein [Candidatus Nanopelagicaceae bacterium]
MGKLVLTGISKSGHTFELDYSVIDGVTKCFAKCSCGFEEELHSFRNPGGTKEVQLIREKHAGVTK